jgi:molybdenum cofactor cytidylyltransferase
MAEEGDCLVAVLAAGGSSRMGEPKQLLRIDGEPLIHRAARIATEAQVGPVVVVLGAEADRIRGEIEDLPVRIVLNAGWREGLASSLRAAVEAAERAQPVALGLLVLPADQPRLTAAHLRALVAAQRADGASLVASDYGEHRGPPALFAASQYAALRALCGDAGARDLLRGKDVLTVAAPPGSGLDLDRPEDIDRLRDG